MRWEGVDCLPGPFWWAGLCFTGWEVQVLFVDELSVEPDCSFE